MFRSLFPRKRRKLLPDQLDKPLIFIHLPKTAGTTFRFYLHSLMPSKDYIAAPHYGTHKPIAEFFGDCSKRLYMGHLPYHSCHELKIKGYYITFLREPLARIFSAYCYRKTPTLLPALMHTISPKEIAAIRTIQEMSFQEYVLSEDPWIYDKLQNIMSRQLAMDMKNGELKLETAFDVLSRDFYWFGITEEFNGSIQLLNMALFGQSDFKLGAITAQNSSPKYDNTLDEKGRQRLKELNEYDLMLYKNAKALFYERYQEDVIQPILKPQPMQEIHFNSPHYLENSFYARGLCEIEPWGIWSEGSVVILTFIHPLPPKFRLSLRAKAFGPNADKPFVAKVGDSAVSFKLGQAVSEQQLEFNNIAESKTIVIRVPVPTSPKDFGWSHDKRKLGIGLISLRITPSEVLK